MPRAIWKGAVTFGLVHIPVALYPASEDSSIDFDWLDKRSMDPVGYKRINKRTGRDITKENVVKGIKQKDGDYVLLNEEQIKEAYPKATQTIEIEAFVEAAAISMPLMERPYYLEPAGKAGKVYALLREAMLAAGVVGIARVVMHTKEHLAAVMPYEGMLLLNTIRWASEIRSARELKIPAAGGAASKLKPAELKMAAQLIKDMTADWKADDYKDQFTGAIQKLVDKKLKAGDTETVRPLEEASVTSESSNVVDLTELLSRSLGGRKVAAPRAPAVAARPAVRRRTRRRA